MTTNDRLDVVWGILLIIIAFQWLPVVGLLGALVVGMAGIKIGFLPFDRVSRV